MIVRVIQFILIFFLIVVLAMFFRDYVRNKEEVTTKKHVLHYIIGLVCEFFDTLGIGCYAPLTTCYRAIGVSDDLIPGTLNVGSSIAVLVEALIFITVIEVDPLTLLLVTVISGIGAFVGAKLTSMVKLNVIRVVLGTALLVAAVLMVCNLMGWIPGGGDEIGLRGGKLIVLLIAEFIFGALISFGLGNYAPSMVVVYLLGMSPLVAFPMMMCSAATGLSTAAIGFIRQGNFDRRACIGNILGGTVGVLIAAFIVKSLPLTVLKWLVVCVATYTAITLYRAATRNAENKPKSE